MSFQFNWAGLNVPTVNMGQEVDMNRIGENLGKGLRGYRNREAADEYARKIDAYRNRNIADRQGEASEIEKIQAEIARLQQENAQIDLALGNAGQAVDDGPASSSVRVGDLYDEDPVLQKFLAFDPQQALYTNKANPYTKDEIKEIQRYIGMPESEVDGVWGPGSQGYYQKFINI